MRHPVGGEVTRVGRSAENDIVVDAAMVSARHLEIRKDGDAYRVQDLNSTNGTYVNGQRITEAALEAPCVIRLGSDGPELSFVLDEAEPLPNLDQTVMITAVPRSLNVGAPDDDPLSSHEDLLSDAVAKARPHGVKGTYIQSCTLSATMSPPVRVDVKEFVAV